MKGQENTRCERLVETDPKHTKLSYGRWQVPFSHPAEKRSDSRSCEVLLHLQHQQHFAPWPLTFTRLHPHTYLRYTQLPIFLHLIPFLIHQPRKRTHPPTYFIPNQHNPSTNLSLSTALRNNPQVTFAPTLSDFGTAILFSLISCNAFLSVLVGSLGQGCRVPMSLWVWMVFGANGAPTTGRPFQCILQQDRE